MTKKEDNEDLFYTDEKNLTDKVEQLIKENNFKSKDVPKDLIQVFDWSKMIEEYDRIMDSLL